MKERRDLGQEGFRTGGIHERRDPVKKGDRKGGKQGVCETGEMLDRRYTGKVECRTCGMEEEDWRVQERRDEKKEGSRQGCRGAGQQGCRKVWIQERRESIDEGCKFGSEMTN